MTDLTTAGEVVSLAAAGRALGLPALLDYAVRGVGSKLFGPALSVPAAWLDQRAQAIRDRTEARSDFARSVVAHAGEYVGADRSLVGAELADLLHDHGVRVERRARAFRVALDRVAERQGEAGEGTATPRDDFLSLWRRLVEDVDDEAMRELLGRILAGEILSNGSFSLKTLRVASELETDVARHFEGVWARSVGEYFVRSGYFERSPGIEILTSLHDAGLTSTENMTLEPEEGMVFVGDEAGELPVARLTYDPDAGAEEIDVVSITMFSRAGRELGRVLPAPDREANLRALAELGDRRGWRSLELLRPGVRAPPEMVWTAS